VVIGALVFTELLKLPRAKIADMLKSSVGLLRYVNPAGFVVRAPMASEVDGT
jgi:hypothetical protein